jgi:hypothetical protein
MIVVSIRKYDQRVETYQVRMYILCKKASYCICIVDCAADRQMCRCGSKEFLVADMDAVRKGRFIKIRVL